MRAPFIINPKSFYSRTRPATPKPTRAIAEPELPKLTRPAAAVGTTSTSVVAEALGAGVKMVDKLNEVAVE